MDLFPNSPQKSRHLAVLIRKVCLHLHKDVSTAEMSLLSPQSCLLTFFLSSRSQNVFIIFNRTTTLSRAAGVKGQPVHEQTLIICTLASTDTVKSNLYWNSGGKKEHFKQSESENLLSETSEETCLFIIRLCKRGSFNYLLLQLLFIFISVCVFPACCGLFILFAGF